MDRSISKLNIFRVRRRFFTHAIPYVFVNLLIIAAWIDPQPGRLYSGLGVISVTLAWTPIFLIHLVRYYFLEVEYQKTSHDGFSYKPKREDFAAANLKHKNCAQAQRLQREEFILCLSNNRLTTPHLGTIKLTRTECLLMQVLMQRSEQPVAIDHLNRQIWGYEAQDMSALKNTVYRLRKKVEPIPNKPSHIVFIPDEGYAFFP